MDERKGGRGVPVFPGSQDLMMNNCPFLGPTLPIYWPIPRPTLPIRWASMESTDHETSIAALWLCVCVCVCVCCVWLLSIHVHTCCLYSRAHGAHRI